MERNRELEHLRRAEADIEAGRKRVERQGELINHLDLCGHDTTTAKSLLQTMRDTLAAMEEHRRLIMTELSR